MDNLPKVNLDQVLCRYHGDDVLELGWSPLYERWIKGQLGCEDCREKARSFANPDGALQIRDWLDVPQALSAEHKAGHEAAHAVVGKHRGVIVNSAWVGDDQVEVAGKAIPRGGGIDYEFTGPLRDLAAMTFAGWAADRVWLKAQGLQGNRAAELAAARASGIDMGLLAEYDAPMDVYLDAKREADELVREHEREIRAVQDELIRHQHLGGEAITAAMDLAHRPKRQAPSSTNKPKTGGDTTTGTQQTAPPLAGAGASTTSNSGGTGMAGIEEIAIAVSQTTEDSERMRAALMEVQQIAEQATGRLGTVLADSSQPEVHEGISAFKQISQQVVELVQLAAGATDGLQAYRNRL